MRRRSTYLRHARWCLVVALRQRWMPDRVKDLVNWGPWPRSVRSCDLWQVERTCKYLNKRWWSNALVLAPCCPNDSDDGRAGKDDQDSRVWKKVGKGASRRVWRQCAGSRSRTGDILHPQFKARKPERGGWKVLRNQTRLITLSHSAYLSLAPPQWRIPPREQLANALYRTRMYPTITRATERELRRLEQMRATIPWWCLAMCRA